MSKKEEFALTVQSLEPKLELVAPTGSEWQRNVNILMGRFLKDPKLSRCSKTSFAVCCMAVTTLNLNPHEDLQLIYLIPRGNDATVMVSYKGYIEIAKQRGATDVRADVVYASEVEDGSFNFTREPHPSITHGGSLSKTGDVVGAYAVAVMQNGTRLQAVISRDDIDRARKCAHGGGKSGPWKDHFDQMAKKTAIRALLRSGRVSLSERIASALSMDEEQHTAVEVKDEPLVLDQDQRGLEAMI